MGSKSSQLWELPLDDAVRLKFELGREGKGDKWEGKHPLVEAHEEVLDALVYIAVDGGHSRALEMVAEELRETIVKNKGFPRFDADAFNGHTSYADEA